jgi:hypothetical protein
VINSPTVNQGVSGSSPEGGAEETRLSADNTLRAFFICTEFAQENASFFKIKSLL